MLPICLLAVASWPLAAACSKAALASAILPAALYATPRRRAAAPRSTLFPYTTLFRSGGTVGGIRVNDLLVGGDGAVIVLGIQQVAGLGHLDLRDQLLGVADDVEGLVLLADFERLGQLGDGVIELLGLHQVLGDGELEVRDDILAVCHDLLAFFAQGGGKLEGLLKRFQRTFLVGGDSCCTGVVDFSHRSQILGEGGTESNYESCDGSD